MCLFEIVGAVTLAAAINFGGESLPLIHREALACSYDCVRQQGCGNTTGSDSLVYCSGKVSLDYLSKSPATSPCGLGCFYFLALLRLLPREKPLPARRAEPGSKSRSSAAA